MQVILLNDVEKLGLRGDVVDVARGYARNFLLPRRLAQPATPGLVAELRRRETRRARHEAASVDQARDIGSRLEQVELRFDVKAGPTGSLFGSVTATDLVDELWGAHKIRVDRRKVELLESIKRVGRYRVPIEIFTDVRAEVRVLVVPEGGELPPEEQLVSEPPASETGAAAKMPPEEEEQAAAEGNFDRAVDAVPVAENSPPSGT